ncbi:transglutaminase-like domain-containing protein [Polaromonas sp. JS666]|uniref:transglutaminase-like domain-containing protein n=1 Tax=Polaromonas sp. (strain JS666 / ATCC BAA-500) TaxID=296591 RepID=UPI0000463ED4|nr:hypothetical protein Bpro_2907 [Polaromonas sp. JS666]
MTQVWLPIPSVNADYQRSLENSFSSNGTTRLTQDGRDGVKMLYAEFPAAQGKPFVELTSRVQTQGRAVDWSQKTAAPEEADTLRYFTRPTALIPTDGIVRKMALSATRGARTDVEKAQKLYDWIVANTYREPKIRGCGEGDIKTMLETGNLGGKCADLNALFVGLCRSEVYLKGYGWAAMDPADVAKVMRLETANWIKNITDPVVAPVNKALFGGWEGNWMAYNAAHDVALPKSSGEKLGFFMYPIAENTEGRVDSTRRTISSTRSRPAKSWREWPFAGRPTSPVRENPGQTGSGNIGPVR